MTMRTAGDAARAADGAIASYQEQIQELAAERASVLEKQRAIEKDIDSTLRDLASALLPDADEARVAAADAAAGGAGLRERLRTVRAEQEARHAEIHEIQGAPEYRERELLIHPTTGSLSTASAEAHGALESTRPEVTRFAEDGEFQATMKVTRASAPGGFLRVVRSVLLYGYALDHLRARRAERVVARYQEASVEACIARFERATEAHELWLAEANRLDAEIQRITDMVSRRAELLRELAETEAGLVATLREQLFASLKRAGDLAGIRERSGEEARPLVTTVIVLREKEKYLESLAEWLLREVSDREKTMNKIRSVQSKWRSAPHKGLRTGDKTKWLVTLPENKRQATRRQVKQCRVMESGIFDFDDYLLYDRLLDRADADSVLAWDVFSRCAPERMPGQGFVYQALPEVELFRDTYGPPMFGDIDAAGMDDGSSPAGGGGGAGGEWAGATLADGATVAGLEGSEVTGFFGADEAAAQDIGSDPAGEPGDLEAAEGEAFEDES